MPTPATVKAYGDCTGPLGFRMSSKAAKAVEDALRTQSHDAHDRFKAAVDGHTVDGYARMLVVPKAIDLIDGEHADVSVVTADGVDHAGDVVLPDGLDFSLFRTNAVVPWCHDYERPPVGRCEWVTQTPVVDGDGFKGKGWKAKTRFTPRPDAHPAAAEWFPDTVWGFVKAGDIRGKSIGFAPLALREPTPDELKRRPAWKGAQVISRALMLEYSVCPIGMQPQSIVETVAKMRTKGLIVPRSFLDANGIVLPDGPQCVADVTGPDDGAVAYRPANKPREKIVLTSGAGDRDRVAGKSASVAFKGLSAGGDEPLAATYQQYLQTGNTLTPVGDADLGDALPKHAYRVDADPWTGEPTFTAFAPKTDDLIRFRSSVAEDVLAEIDRFWTRKAAYDKLGLTHTRGVMLYGPPGTGKTCILHQVAEMVVGRGDVVLYGRNVRVVAAGLAAFREVEPDRKAVVVLEDADEYVGWQERDFLQLLDGERSIDGVLYLATTNYIESFPPRLLRPGRFDQKVLVGPPDLDARTTYLTAKVVDTDAGKPEDVARLAAETDGFGFGDLRELVVAIFALGEAADDALARLKGATGGWMKAYAARVKSLRKAADDDVTPPVDDVTPPADRVCPKCDDGKAMTRVAGGTGGYRYCCPSCGDEYTPDGETVGKAATADPAPAALPNPAPPAAKAFVRPDTIQKAIAAKRADASAAAKAAGQRQAADEIARILGRP